MSLSFNILTESLRRSKRKAVLAKTDLRENLQKEHLEKKVNHFSSFSAPSRHWNHLGHMRCPANGTSSTNCTSNSEISGTFVQASLLGSLALTWSGKKRLGNSSAPWPPQLAQSRASPKGNHETYEGWSIDSIDVGSYLLVCYVPAWFASDTQPGTFTAWQLCQALRQISHLCSNSLEINTWLCIECLGLCWLDGFG